jgi:hypothetical protein
VKKAKLNTLPGIGLASKLRTFRQPSAMVYEGYAPYKGHALMIKHVQNEQLLQTPIVP